MSKLFDEEQGQALSLKALKILEKPPEVQKDDPFTINASLATEFILVGSVEEYKANGGIKFQPDYMHQVEQNQKNINQVFRETNEIYGYKDLKLNIYVTRLRLIPLVKYTYSEMCEDADDLEGQLIKLYEGGFLKSHEENQFIKILEEEQNSTPCGKHLATYGQFFCQTQLLDERFDIYMSTINTNGFAELKPNLQALLKILIDGAQFPCDSIYWVYFLLYEKINNQSHFRGLCTIYTFNITLSVSRYRISQMLFLPSYQRKGHGGKLLRAVYEYCWKQDRCIQITLEDPSEDFQVMRDITDTKVLISDFQRLKDIQMIKTPAQLNEHLLSQNELRRIMRKTRFVAQQVKRVHQILLYAKLDKTSKQTMVAFGDFLLKQFEKSYSYYKRVKNPLVIFENGEGLNQKQLNLLELKEKQDRKQINYEELIIEEFSFFEIITSKLRKDKVI